ncbi:LysR family transcriptional regulator substrate-binding protein [Leucobacter coleopterorum]|uniref:LysR family transcriptional regulator substrate-binding protein n=1 Tax=Leucobacter coleopterorum TaxID=2714933 RepID=UPI003137E4EC
MLADADTARGEMAELAGLRRGRIRLGATPTLCTSLVADVLAEFRHRHPGIDVEILERGSRTLIEALVEGSLDLALIVTSVSSGAARAVLERKAVLRESLVVVSASSDPSPFTSIAGSAAEIEDLAELPHIMFPKNYDLRVAVDAALQAHDVHPFVAVEGAEMDAVLRFVERGIGIAVVPAMVAVDRPLLRATPLADQTLTRTISIARRSDMTPTPASTALQSIIQEVADRLTTPGAATAELVGRV